MVNQAYMRNGQVSYLHCLTCTVLNIIAEITLVYQPSVINQAKNWATKVHQQILDAVNCKLSSIEI